jgi:hypothetical protein
MEIPRFDKMNNRELLLILVGLLVIVGLVSAFLTPVADLGGCCSGTMVVNKNRNNAELFHLTEWTIEKYSNNNNIINGSSTPIEYWVNITELETNNNTFVLHGFVTVKNTGKNPAYLGNAVLNIMSKDGGWTVNASDVATYDDSITSVETCKLTGGSGSVTYSEGPGSGDITLSDPFGNNPFAGTSLYELPGNNNLVVFNYSATFYLDELGLEIGDQFREQIILTFINAPTGGGSCTGIDADGDGNVDSYTRSEYSWDPPSSYGLIPLTSDSTYEVHMTDIISSSPDSSIVSIPDWTIDTSGTLQTNGGNEYVKTLTATGIPGTVTSILLNSTATCLDDGTTFIRNKVNLTDGDLSVIYGSPTFSQINFVCGDIEVPPRPIGEICTFTQAAYGGVNLYGYEVMEANATFPIVVGNTSTLWLNLTSALEASEFLPQNGTPSYLTANLTDPGVPTIPLNWSTSARQFAGEVVALQLNVDLSDAGKMPQTSDEIFGDLFVVNTSSSFDGMKVRDVLGIANCLLANGTNCNGYTTANISELNGALEKLNMNYLNCENDFNHTTDDDEAPVIISVEAVPDLLYPGQNYVVSVIAIDNIKVTKVNITVNGSGYILTDMGNDTWNTTINAPLSGTHTIHVNAYDAVWNSDYDDSESITVDSADPVITLNTPTNNSVIAPGTTLDFSVTDANLDSVKVNYTPGSTAGTSMVDFASPFDINTSTWADGIHTIYIWANDTVANNASDLFRFTIDSTAPEANVSATPNITNNEENVTFTADVDDEHYDSNNVYLHCENGAAFTVKMTCTGASAPYTCTYEWDPINDGIYTCTVNATDQAGNTGTSDPITVIIDSIAPVISLNDPTEYSYIEAGDKINISVTNDEYDDLEEVWFSTDGGLTNSTLPNTTDPLYYLPTDGLECQFTFDVWARDSAGNVGHENFTFNIDDNDPEINLVTVSAPSPLWPSMKYNITVNATDSKMMDLVNVTVNGVEYTLTQNATDDDLWYRNDLVAPGPGSYPVNVTAYDKSGKSSYDDSQSITVTLPPGPSIVLDSPANGATIKNTVPIVVNITNSTFYQVDTTLFNSSYNTTMRPFDSVSGISHTIDVSSYPDGTYTFYVFANDTNNAQSNATYSFTVDSTKPLVENFTITPDLFSSGTSVTFSADVYEEIGLGYSNRIWFRCKNSTGSWKGWIQSNTCTGSLPNLECSKTLPISYADGVYQCKAYAWDKAGNSDSTPYETMTIDSTAPVITVNDPLPTGSTITSGTLINLSVTNGVYDSLDTVQYQVDGGGLTDLSSPFDIPTGTLPDGEHCFNVSANDTAGNSNTESFCYKFDNTAPVIHSVTPDPDYFVGGGPFNISVNATDMPFPADFESTGMVEVFAGLNSYNLTFNSSSGFWEGSGLYYAPPPESCGLVYLTVTATDVVGNSATDTDTPLKIIGCNPVIILLSPSDGSVISSNSTIDLAISHPFNVTANYSVNGGAKTPLASPYDIHPTPWGVGNHTVFVEAVDEYGYYSNASYTFRILPFIPPGPPDGDKDMDVSWSRVCPTEGGSQIKLIAKDGIKNLDDVNVKLYHDDIYLIDTGQADVTDQNGEVIFGVTSAGQYAASFRDKPGYNNEMLYGIQFELCEPVIPPGCDDDVDCPGDEICVEGECVPPECDDDLDCPSGQICVEGRCQPEPPECTEDEDCEEGMICLNGECVPEEPECETDADCAEGFVCEDGSCEGVPKIKGDPEEGVVGGPGETTEIEFNITNIGSAPVTNVNVRIGGLGETGEVLSTGPVIPELKPGESGTVSAVVRIGDNALPGDHTFAVTYTSDEVIASDEFSFSVSEEVTPGILFEDAALCLIPLLLLLILLALLPFLKKKVVADAESFKGLSKLKKLNLLEDYFVPDSAFMKLAPKMRKKCKGVKVGAAKVAAIMKRHKLTKDDAMLVAVAKKVNAKKIITTSKSLSKLVKLQEKLEGINFFSLDSILKPKK